MTKMNYTHLVENDICNGLGIRVSLFVSGCRNNCPGCFNQGNHSFNAGKSFTFEIKTKIFDLLAESHISGLSILGGEPMEEENQIELVSLIFEAKKMFPNKNVWLYTGYDLKEDIIPENGKKHLKIITNNILNSMDGSYIIDGKYIESLKDPMLSYRGSINQHIYRISIDEKYRINYTDESSIFDKLKRGEY